MKVIPGGFAGGAPSGSLGSGVASHNRGGYYVRNRVIPVNPNTGRQQTIRAFFTSLVNFWTNTLTQAQRDAWDAYGANTPVLDRLGQTIFLTGQNQYVRTNVPRRQLGQARVDAAPIIFDTGSPVTNLKVITDGTDNTLAVNLAGDSIANSARVTDGASDDGDIGLYLGAPINASRKFFKGPYQLAAQVPIASAAVFADFTDLITALANGNGVLAAGQYRGARLRVIYDDGRVSADYKFLSTVATDSA